MSKKERLDLLIVQRGLIDSRSKAQALIRAGEVFVNGQRMDKPGMGAPRDAKIELKAKLPFVGRGGLKLAAALEAFGIDPRGWACLDVGASTGGFTDCLLQAGSATVYAVDVGRAQLAWKLRSDPRVVEMERTDIRKVDTLPEPIDLAVVDVAFISVLRVLPTLRRHLSDTGQVVALIKPQFEVGKERIGKGGIVREPELRKEVLIRIIEWADREGWHVAGLCDSPISGQSGNREFLLHLDLRPSEASVSFELGAVVSELDGLRPA